MQASVLAKNEVEINTGEGESSKGVQCSKPYANEETACVNPSTPLLNKDNNFDKYERMLKMGLSLGAVENTKKRDGKKPSEYVNTGLRCVSFLFVVLE